MSHTILVASPRLSVGWGIPNANGRGQAALTKQRRFQSRPGAPAARTLRVRIHDIDVRSLRGTDVRNTDI